MVRYREGRCFCVECDRIMKGVFSGVFIFLKEDDEFFLDALYLSTAVMML